MSNIETAVYGASASIIANTIVYPLDLIKTVIQTQLKEEEDYDDLTPEQKELRYKNSLDCFKKILKRQGVAGLYKGLGSSLLSTAIQSFTYFYWYSFVRKLWRYVKLKKLNIKNLINSTPEELLIGIIAAALGQLFTSPISVISTRQQTCPKKNPTILKSAENIYKNDGITGFWRGLKVSLVLTINPSITYATFEKLRQILFNNKQKLKPYESFILGVVSKMLATFITQPLIISKAILQKNEGQNSNNKSEQLKSFQSVLIYLFKNEGPLSLWKGILPQLSKGVLVQGFVFMFRDQLYSLFRRIFYLMKLRSIK